MSALVLQVLAIQTSGTKLDVSMCLLQCPHCTDEVHIGRTSAPCLQFTLLCMKAYPRTWPDLAPYCAGSPGKGLGASLNRLLLIAVVRQKSD